MRDSMEDTALLYVPQFSDDYWVKETDERCKERLANPGCICPQPEEGDSDVRDRNEDDQQTSVTTAPRRRVKKGELLSTVAASLKDIRVRLLVVKLQHQCCECGQYLRDKTHYCIPEGCWVEPVIKSRTGRQEITRQKYVCETCLSLLPLVERDAALTIPAIAPTLQEKNTWLVCRMFESRQIFMTICQFYHYQFDQVNERSE